ncbi:MAG: hypothetical protein RL193_805 [Actinomycetota bacterium]
MTTDQKVRGSNPLGRAMQKILLTGFERFHKASANPTEAIVKELAKQGHSDLITSVLPVEFGKSWQQLKALIDTHKPAAVIALGQAEGRSQITPEQIAINLDNARIADNAGQMPSNQPIVVGGLDGLFSTLPINEIVEKISQAGIPANVSLSAGTFVCNHLFYLLQSYTHGSNIKSGFIHVPLMESQADEFPGLPTMKLEELVRSVDIVISTMRNQGD